MAKKLGTRYECGNCGAISASYTGRCASCGQWNSLQQQVDVSTATAGASGKTLKIESVKVAAETKTTRLSSGIDEVDEVLGGGLVAGSSKVLLPMPG